ncbi:MAG: hypothetical protein ACI4MM_12575 [Candidatus Ventricola sp.]
MISTITRAIIPMRNESVPLRGFTRRSTRRFFFGGLEWIIRLERMEDSLSNFDKIAENIIAQKIGQGKRKKNFLSRIGAFFPFLHILSEDDGRRGAGKCALAW